MRTWAYAMPTICWLLYGRQFVGTVVAPCKSQARAELKRRLGIDRLPPGTVMARCDGMVADLSPKARGGGM